MARECFVCHSCGEKVECSGKARPCEVLEGWVMVSLWNGPETVEHYSFCSLVCLKSWLDAQVPEVPTAFLKAFGEGEE